MPVTVVGRVLIAHVFSLSLSRSTFKQALTKMFAAQDKGCVFFERHSFTRGQQHCHVQVIPMISALMSVVKGAFLNDGAQRGINFVELPTGTPTQEAMREAVRGFSSVLCWSPDHMKLNSRPAGVSDHRAATPRRCTFTSRLPRAIACCTSVAS